MPDPASVDGYPVSPTDSWRLDRPALETLQLERLNALLAEAVPACPLYRRRLGPRVPRLAAVGELSRFPLTTKEDLVAAAEAGEWLTRPAAEYVRFHQTSGTRGAPLPVPDTAADWGWWLRCWGHTLAAAGVGPGDRAVLAFSFGPFVGFWSAFDALVAHGVCAVPAGGMSSEQRIDLIARTGANRLFCTPSYALHLADAGARRGIDVAGLAVETVVVAGEPGGSLPATRDLISAAWGARVVDHAGATEVGPWGFGDDLWSDPPGLRVLESEFVAEFLGLDADRPAGPGELARLVLTNLGRRGAPLIRYETGDLVRPEWPAGGACRFVRLVGGVVGRGDDMIVVRGVNVFPSSVEGVMRTLPAVGEWRLVASRRGAMDELLVEFEGDAIPPDAVATELQTRLGLRIEAVRVAAGALPRGEHKARRLVDQRGERR